MSIAQTFNKHLLLLHQTNTFFYQLFHTTHDISISHNPMTRINFLPLLAHTHVPSTLKPQSQTFFFHQLKKPTRHPHHTLTNTDKHHSCFLLQENTIANSITKLKTTTIHPILQQFKQISKIKKPTSKQKKRVNQLQQRSGKGEHSS